VNRGYRPLTFNRRLPSVNPAEFVGFATQVRCHTSLHRDRAGQRAEHLLDDVVIHDLAAGAG
jgi:hypothetical protein